MPIIELDQLDGEGKRRLHCTDCGLTTNPTTRTMVMHRCGKDGPIVHAGITKIDGPPPIVRTVWNYATSMKRWNDAGCPTRTDEEVAEALEICDRCQYYKNGHCKQCGCKVNDSKWAIVNKIRMATESCPIGKWKATVDVGE